MKGRSIDFNIEPFPFVVPIHSGCAEVDNFRASISVLFKQTALMAIIGFGDSGRIADNALCSEVTEIALVADLDQLLRFDICIADHAPSIASFAQFAYSDARQLPAHDEIGMMSRHSDNFINLM